MSDEDVSKKNKTRRRKKAKSFITRKFSSEENDEVQTKSNKKKAKSMREKKSNDNPVNTDEEPSNTNVSVDKDTTEVPASSNKARKSFKDKVRNRFSPRKNSKSKLTQDSDNECNKTFDLQKEESTQEDKLQQPLIEGERDIPDENEKDKEEEEEKWPEETSEMNNPSEDKSEDKNVEEPSVQQELNPTDNESTEITVNCKNEDKVIEDVSEVSSNEKEEAKVNCEKTDAKSERDSSSPDVDNTTDLDDMTTVTEEQDIFNEAISEVLSLSGAKSSITNDFDDEQGISIAKTIITEETTPTHAVVAEDPDVDYSTVELDDTNSNSMDDLGLDKESETGKKAFIYGKGHSLKEDDELSCVNESIVNRLDTAPILQINEDDKKGGCALDTKLTNVSKNTCESLEERPLDWEYIEHPQEISEDSSKKLTKLAAGKFYKNMRMTKTYCACCSIM